ncbi:MAG: S8 family serine peptidase [Candidatus Heimdallarchaeota archaeon]|nr:S8 family serine peptidase [Candidatus Heimdallarchaeota archaeon]
MISKRTMSSLVIFGLLILSFTSTSNTLAKTNGDYSSISGIEQPDIPIDHHLVKVDDSQDVDQDLIQDSFKEKLILSDKTETFEAIISFTGPITKAERTFLQTNDIEIISEFTVIYAAHVRGTAESLLLTKNLGTTLYLEENGIGHALMLDVTEDFGVRKVWQVSQGYGYTGNPNTAIAILDTGIDDSHPDSNFNVVYWHDYEGADYSVSGDEYLTPTDKGEHGTHVASIAASNGASSSGSSVSLQDSGFFPGSGYANYGSWFYIPSAQTVTINYVWEGTGSYYVGFLDSSYSWVTSSPTDSSSPGSYSYYFSTPGFYCAMYGTPTGIGGDFYSGEVVYNNGWTNPYSDGYGSFAGVAPDSNIVGLKVLDDRGTGTSASLINALNWLYFNGQSYNVTVVNMSIGWPAVYPSIDSAVSSLVRNKGIVCVISAGNDGTSSGGVYSPGSCLDAITVGSVNKASEIAYYSSNGHSSQGFIKPDVVAPGGSYAPSGSSAPTQPIIASDSNDADEAYDYGTSTSYLPKTDYYTNNFREFQGTSMAAPFVAGLVQLIVDAMMEEGTYTYSWDTAKKIKQIICMSASEVYNIEGAISTGGETYDPPSPVGDGIPQYPGWTRDTKDYVEGWGVVSVEGAIQAVTDWLSVGTTELINLSGRQYGSHVAVRQMNLEAGVIYKLYGEFNLGTFTDADLFIMDTDPDVNGEPVILSKCVLGIVTEESSIFSVPDDDVYYLVAKWSDGVFDGSCNVKVSEVVTLTSHTNFEAVHSDTVIGFDIDTVDIASVEYRIDADPYNPLSSPYEVTLPGPEGVRTISIRLMHDKGQMEEMVFTFTVDDSVEPSSTRSLSYSTAGILIASVVSISIILIRKKRK